MADLWQRGLTAGAVALIAVGIVAVPWPERVEAETPQCAETAGSEAKAVSLAVSCGQPVVVDGSRTEFAEVTALPDGRLQFSSAVAPQRTRKDGRWADIDLNLAQGADGRWRPTAAVAEVAFSGGGDTPMVTLTRGGSDVALSWPQALPVPTVSGDSLTYADVLPDVDLVVRATRTGFTHALVVKTPVAAKNPAVRTVRFRLGGEATVLPAPDGSLRAIAGNAVIASAEPAMMWDSRTGPAGATSARGLSAGGAQSTATEAGDAAHVGDVDVEVSQGDLVLRPDVTLLDDPDTVFPLFVDPTWSVYKAKWAYGTSDGSSNSDTSVARVGRNPDTGALYRSYFAFPTTANKVSLKDKHIESAYVQMKLDHSWSCGPTVTSMYLTPVINAMPKASWSTMKLKVFLDSASGNANEAGGCGSIQPDMLMNFRGSTVTEQVEAAAKGSSITVGFTARASDGSGESTQDRWKRFFPNNAKLFVDYDSKPSAPNGLQIAGVTCGSGVTTIGTLTPTFSAVFRDADTSDSLTGRFEWIQVPSGGMGAVTDTSPTRKTAPPAKTGVTPNTRATSSAVTVTKGPVYAFRARATDKTPYSITGPWSSWCQFTPDTTVPPAPTITPGTPGGPGRTMTFTISTTATDVTKFRYGWSSPPTTEIAASGTNPKTATVTVTVPTFGQNTFWARGVDATGNIGNIGSADFTAPRSSPAIAKWGLETYPGVNQTAALADGQPTMGDNDGTGPLVNDTPLIAANVTWAPDARLVGGNAASFNGTSSRLVASGRVLDTADSFSVAAWVRVAPASGCTNLVALSGEGSGSSAFTLGYDCWAGKWRMRVVDKEGGAFTDAPSSGYAEVGRWTHLAGMYDEVEKKVKLYVDGVLAASVTPSSAWLTARGNGWTATNSLVVGRSRWFGVDEGYFKGEIADVQVFNRVLVPEDFTGQLAQDPGSGGFHEPGMLTSVQVGNWNFEAATPCYVANLRGTCEAPDSVTAWGRYLALTRGATVGAGHSTSGSGLWLDSEYFPDEGYTEVTEEYGRSAIKTGTTPPDADGLEFTQWQDKSVLRTDQSFTMSSWVALDRLDGTRTAVSHGGSQVSAAWLGYQATTGKWQFAVNDEDVAGTPTASVSSALPAEVDVWTHLTGVYDAGRKQLRLYVNGEFESTQDVAFTPMASSGSLLVGRALWRGEITDRWTGGIDDVTLHQGALTDTSVFILYNSQVPPGPGSNTLLEGETLTQDQYLRSDAGNYLLVMQPDGNLVLSQAGIPLWDTGTSGREGAEARFQPDGNFVIYSTDGVSRWHTGTWSTAANRLVLRDDGDLVLLDPTDRVLWRR
ncbi:LamG-like jellyroll fold domain-containing protein [Micromonosporaceae bacterium DT194]|uniref:LamG-like jellyroll fold domain-containing protein n=1 Tax=Melissospora conviva TaxID=3388432 RepID=UPI003C244343